MKILGISIEKSGKKFRDRILFISSPIISNKKTVDTLDYFSSIVSELSIKLRLTLPNFDLVVKVPEGEKHPKENQKIIIKQTIEILKGNKEEYKAIIISPYDKSDIIEEIKDLQILSKIYLIDQGYETDSECSYFKGASIPRPPFVQSDWYEGGKIAGNLFIDHFKRTSNLTPNILSVEGLVGSKERVDGLKEAFKIDGTINPSFSSIKGYYNKDSAKKAFEPILNSLISTGKWYDGIFSTNDEMAIGIREVLIEKKSQLDNHYPKIIGFDGIRDITFLIDGKDEFILNTVDVQILEQINILTNIITNQINGTETENLFVKLRPKLYKP